MKTRNRPNSSIRQFGKVLLICTFCTAYSCGGGGGGNSNVGDTAGSNTQPPTSSGGSNPGNGGDTSNTFSGGISGSGSIRSRIQGFGSVIVNDDEYDTSSTVFVVEGDESAVQEDLDIGQIVTMETDFDNLTASKLEYRATLKAPIDTIVVTDALNGEATITSLGQTILTTAATNFQNTDLSQFLAGDLIEVSGFQNENQNIVSSFIEKKNELDEYKLIGTVSSLTSNTFTIGILVVDYSSANLDDFEGTDLSDGQLVELEGSASGYTAPDRFMVSSVELLPQSSVASDDRLEVEGIITRFVSFEDFDVSSVSDSVPVTASETETVYINGDKESLALGVILEVEGGVNQSGTLEAVEITFKPSSAIRVEAAIDSVDSAGNTLTALGLVFTIRDSTQLEDESDAELENLELADLNPGDRVELRAFSDGAALVASKIERKGFEDKSSLRGPVTAKDTAQGTLEILGIPITTDANTEYETETEETETELTQSEFFEILKLGDILEADWQPFISTDDAVTALEIEDE